MLRKLMLAVIPMAALAGVVRADDIDGLADFGDSSFEVDALTAALTGDELVADADVLAVSGSEATEDIDAEAACYGYYRSFRRSYHYGWNTFRAYNHCYRPVYRVYRPVFHCYRPVVRYYRHYCW